MPANKAIQSAQQSQLATKGQHQPRGQPTSFLVVDDQKTGPLRPLSFTLTLTKHFKMLSVASVAGEESQNNISGLSSLFGNLQSVMSYQQIATPEPFLPPVPQQHAASPPTITAQQEHQQPPYQPQSPLQIADAKQQQQ